MGMHCAFLVVRRSLLKNWLTNAFFVKDGYAKNVQFIEDKEIHLVICANYVKATNNDGVNIYLPHKT